MPGYTALINPISGGGRAARVWAPIAEHLAAQGITVTERLTRSRQHAIDTADEAAAAGQAVIAVGGDGLVRDVAAGMYGHGTPLAVVPGGRGNDLARKLALPTDPATISAMLAARRTTAIDVLEAAGQIALGNIYVGVDSMATKAINDNRRLPGLLVYRLAPVGAVLRWHAPTFTLSTKDWSVNERLHQVVAANSGRYGYGLDIVPTAELDSGQIDVLTVADLPRYKIAAFLSKARTGAHLGEPGVTVRRTTELRIDADRPVPVYADGDYLGELPVTIAIRPAALDIVTP
jgi:diacylglycerol kinase family enzyme